jgi:hypothetical protein
MLNNKRFPRYVNSSQVKDCIPLKQIQDNPRAELSKLTRKELDVLIFILFINNRHPDIYPRQDTIAKFAHCSLRWVNSTIAKLVSLGLINKIYRANKSCLYRVSSWFTETDVKRRIIDILPVLKIIPLMFLIAIDPMVRYGASSYDIFKGDIYITNKQQSSLNYVPRSNGKIVKKGKVMSLAIRLAGKWGCSLEETAVLESYSDKILEYADKQMLKTTGITNKRAYFLSICRNQSITKPKTNNFSRSDSDNTSTKTPIYNAYIKPEEQSQEQIIDRLQTHKEWRNKRDQYLRDISGND